MAKPAPKPQVHYRDAGQGTYVTKDYADKHKGTAVKEADKGK